MRVKRTIMMSMAATLVCLLAAFGQVERGTIAGTVLDPSGAVVPNVDVTVKNVNTGVEYKTTTGQGGEFVAPNLIPGAYSITASASGFSTLVRSGIELHVNERLAIDLTLQVGAVTQQVEVTAAAPLLKSETSSVETLISRREVSELPLNGRSVFQLTYLAAGSHIGTLSNANNTEIPDNARAKQGLTVNGQRQSANTYILDGVYNNQINQGLIAILPPLEAVQEFTLETSNFNAEIGRGGGVMNVTMKSGTNQFHGQVFNYHRNAALDARNFFDYSTDRRLPNFIRNQFGFTFGGPIRRDQTFFFGDYQGLREVKGQTFTTIVPGAAIRAGDFSGTTRPIYDPATYDPQTDTRQLFQNQAIPSARFNAASMAVLDFFPLPNDPSGQVQAFGQGLFFSSAARRHEEDSFDIKIDHRISDRDQLTGRYSYGDSHTILPGAFSELPEFAPAVGGILGSGGAGFLQGDVENPARSLGIQEIHNFSPRMINEFRFAAVRAGSDALQLNFGTNYAEQLGIPNVNVTENNSGFPGVSIANLASVGDAPFFPLIELENVFQWLDNVTFISGKHTLKFGVDFKKVQRNFTQILGWPAGTFSFGTGFTADPASPGDTGNGFADFLLGIPSSGEIYQNSGLAGIRSSESSGYWQDTWRVTPNLTLNFGVRYDLYTPQTEVYDRMTNFDFGTAMLILPGADNGATNPDQRNRAMSKTDKNNFSPRFGFAYKIGDKNVVRASYGVFYAAESMAGFQMTLNPPFVGGTRFINVSSPQQINRTFDQGLPATDPFIPIDDYSGSINTYSADWTTGYTQQWSFSAQRQITPTILFDTTYVGNSSQHLMDVWNPNQAVPGIGSPFPRTPFYPLTGDRNFSIQYMDKIGRANYHAWQTTLTKRFSRGLSLQTNYTWSHAIESTTHWFGQGLHQDARNLNLDRMSSVNDVRQRWIFNLLYELPFGKGRPYGGSLTGVGNALAGGWQVGSVIAIQSGSPFTVTGGAGRPNRTCDGNLPAGERTVLRWFDPDCFPLPEAIFPDPNQPNLSYIPFGNSANGVIVGPGTLNFDFSIFKSVYLGEETRFEYRAEIFNAFNHAQFFNPSSGVPAPGVAGRIFNARDSRQIQMALRFIF